MQAPECARESLGLHVPPIIRAWVPRPRCEITGSCARRVVCIAASWAKLWELVNSGAGERDKTRLARRASNNLRDNIRPACEKWLFWVCFACAGRVLYRSHDGSGVLGEFCIACGVDAWLSDGKQRDKPPDWRLPRGLAGLAGLRADAPSEARGADGERAGRPRGSRRSGGAAAVAGDMAGLRRWPEIWQASRWPEIWRATANTGRTNGGTGAKNRRPEGRRLFVRHGGLEPSTR